jgi:urease accessory protein
MGQDPARITAADFVTPPEFRDLSLSPNEAGRVGGLYLELGARERETGLAACYQQVPLRTLPPFRLGDGRPVLLYVLNPTAGLLDGDGHLLRLTARAGTHALIVGQSATRIHPCPVSFATQQWAVRVEAGAALAVLPGPSIPFDACRYYQRVAVELDEGADFAWGDIGLAGRYARGSASERFRFAALVQEFHVRREGRLVFRDRFAWRGPWDEATAAWHCGGPAWGTVFATRTIPDTGGARFTTGSGDTCARWTGPAEQVIADVVRAVVGGAALGDALAPVHWFSNQSNARVPVPPAAPRP